MINPLLTKGRFLFVRAGCHNCARWKKFIYKLNTELKIDKRIRIIDCTKFYYFRIYDNPVIKVFEPFFKDYPTLFIEGERKIGTNSEIECRAWIEARLSEDFYFDKDPEYLESIGKYNMFNQKCRFKGGRVFCETM